MKITIDHKVNYKIKRVHVRDMYFYVVEDVDKKCFLLTYGWWNSSPVIFWISAYDRKNFTKKELLEKIPGYYRSFTDAYKNLMKYCANKRYNERDWGVTC